MMLCASLAERTIEACKKTAACLDTQLVEHRIDYLEEIHSLKGLYQSIGQPVIATVRPKWEGGLFTGDENARLDTIMMALGSECAAIDIEHSAPGWFKREAKREAMDRGAMVITSKHIFTCTPPLTYLITLMEDMINDGAKVGKIATMANSVGDCDIIVELLKHAQAKRFPLISFAMGVNGISSRVASLGLGSPFTYVSAGKKTAPGQLDPERMRALLKEVQK